MYIKENNVRVWMRFEVWLTKTYETIYGIILGNYEKYYKKNKSK